jgi:hypothetical protein
LLDQVFNIIIVDCFIERLFNSNVQQGKPRPVLVGIALDEQILTETLPMEAHDR